MRVGIDETGRDRFAPHVEHLRSCGNAAARTDALDAVVFDDDVGILQYLIAFHGHDRRSANHNRALRRLPRGFEIHGDFLDAVVLLLELFGLFLGLFIFFHFVLLLRVLWIPVFLLAFFLFFLGRLESDRAQRLAEEAGANGPGDGLSIVGPSEIVRADVGEPFGGDCGLADVNGRRLAAHLGHGHHVELVHDVGQDPVAVGAHAHVVRGNGLFGKVEPLALHLDVRAAVGTVVTKGDEPSSTGVQIDAVLFVCEVRFARAPRRNDQTRWPAG